ncbi:invasion associated locus B family protein [Tsuneonella sp. HG222]
MRRALALSALLFAAPLAAKDDLGVFETWAAFRDPAVPRCYAIALASDTATAFPAFADIATWPRRGVRNQVHFRLSRALADTPRLVLTLGSARFELTGGGVDAWAVDRRMDAAIVAAMRSASTMNLSATDTAGRRFTDRYELAGVATAMDAATVGCARIR